jgi:oxygen-independent coproporphyrinogen-3 oxidase
MFGIYIHIPYCRRACAYCDFLRTPIPGNVPGRFVDALCREIGEFSGPDEAGSVFFGGGTPSLLAADDLSRILDAVRGRFRLIEPEISLEANPDDVTPELADGWLAAGINRVSLGVQSFDDRVLRYLGRRHDAAGAIAACATVSQRFDNWAMDLIFGAPPIDAWGATLDQCVALGPAHVSAYGLTYEPGTPMFARKDESVRDEQWLDLYREAESRLTGYERYEISNYARQMNSTSRPSKSNRNECRHNLIYWHNEEYAGFGPGAYSFVDGARARNNSDIEGYWNSPGAKEERLELSREEIRLETVIQHLRLRAGIGRQYYRERFKSDIGVDFADALSGLLSRGLIEEDGEAIRPTRAGFELNNEIGLALVG